MKYISAMALLAVGVKTQGLGAPEKLCEVMQNMYAADPKKTERDRQWLTVICDRWASSPPDNADIWTTDMIEVLMGQTERTVNCDGPCAVPLQLEPLYQYGCWCNLGNGLLTGNSVPMDPYDEACKRMQLCLRCVVLDNPNNADCTPSSNDYKANINWNPQTFTLASDCDTDNVGNDCGVGFCTCEVNWLNDILSLGFQAIGLDPSLDHSNNFDVQGNCPILSPNGDRDLQCCGFYPHRYPYNVAKLSCCANVGIIFNDTVDECCANGNGVQSAGSCF
jgi:hypothetical protein